MGCSSAKESGDGQARRDREAQARHDGRRVPLPSGYRKGPPVWDGIAELWFDDTDALRANRGSAEQGAVDADEERFLERGTMTLLFTGDHVIKDGAIPAGGVKNVEFDVQSHVRPSAYTGGRVPAYDGLALTWWDDTNAMRAAATTPEYATTRADEPSFLAPEPRFIITREIVVV